MAALSFDGLQISQQLLQPFWEVWLLDAQDADSLFGVVVADQGPVRRPLKN